MEAAVKGKAIRKSSGFYTKGEEIFNAVSHIAGGGAALIFWAVLAAFAAPSAGNVIAVSVFGASATLLYTMSALYHFLPQGRAKTVFRIFDHCTIFLLIAGTYTPFCLLALEPAAGIPILIAEWVGAAVGVTLNAIAMNNRAVKAVSMFLYVGMGWLALAGLGCISAAVSAAALGLLLGGGIAYTAGIAFFAFGRKVRYFHSVWHLFDVAGTALQFASILLLLV